MMSSNAKFIKNRNGSKTKSVRGRALAPARVVEGETPKSGEPVATPLRNPDRKGKSKKRRGESSAGSKLPSEGKKGHHAPLGEQVIEDQSKIDVESCNDEDLLIECGFIDVESDSETLPSLEEVKISEEKESYSEYDLYINSDTAKGRQQGWLSYLKDKITDPFKAPREAFYESWLDSYSNLVGYEHYNGAQVGVNHLWCLGFTARRKVHLLPSHLELIFKEYLDKRWHPSTRETIGNFLKKQPFYDEFDSKYLRELSLYCSQQIQISCEMDKVNVGRNSAMTLF